MGRFGVRPAWSPTLVDWMIVGQLPGLLVVLVYSTGLPRPTLQATRTKNWDSVTTTFGTYTETSEVLFLGSR